MALSNYKIREHNAIIGYVVESKYFPTEGSALQYIVDQTGWSQKKALDFLSTFKTVSYFKAMEVMLNKGIKLKTAVKVLAGKSKKTPMPSMPEEGSGEVGGEEPPTE